MTPDHKVELWAAIHRYVRACGGDPSSAVSNIQRQNAVVEIEHVATKAVTSQRSPTLEEVKQSTLQSMTDKARTECPCCGQLVKLYPRIIYSSMAHWLIRLVQKFEETQHWVSIEDLPTMKGGDYAKLRHWDLVMLKEKDPYSKDTRTSGLWKPTRLGIDFVHDRARVQKRALVFNREVHRFEGEEVTIRDVLGTDYSYRALMEREWR